IEKDTGMYDGVVNGLRKAKGQFLAHLNSDEQYLPGALKLVKQFFSSHPGVDVVFGDAILVNQDGKPLSYRRVIKPLRAHTLACQLGTLTCSTFFRRSLVERGLGYTSHFRQVEDAAMVLRWIDAGIKMAVISSPLAVFTFTGENMSTGREPKEEGFRLRAANRLLKIPVSSRMEYKVLAPILAVHHRFRKLLHGAYQPRDLELRIYTLSSPNARQVMRVEKLGFGWPRTDPGFAS
ncbi:MAG: glycosyltransferase, partial [Verrucomicrobia bacterium]|nr:glycosyltransferase [Verrucomicrobiota bacterium]